MGFCFDFYRIVRWRLGLNKILTFIGDLFFSLLALLVLFYFAQKANYLEWRFYLFGGSLLGLFLYLQFLSPFIKKVFNGIFNLAAGLKRLILGMVMAFFKSSLYILAMFMSIPYGLLRWLGLLLFRFWEALSKESVNKIKGRIPKTPRE